MLLGRRARRGSGSHGRRLPAVMEADAQAGAERGWRPRSACGRGLDQCDWRRPEGTLAPLARVSWSESDVPPLPVVDPARVVAAAAHPVAVLLAFLWCSEDDRPGPVPVGGLHGLGADGDRCCHSGYGSRRYRHDHDRRGHGQYQGRADCDVGSAWVVRDGRVPVQTVWNVVTDRPPTSGIKDYDVFYFDRSDLSWEAEDVVIKTGQKVFAGLPAEVEIRNEARVHLWYEESSEWCVRRMTPPRRRSTASLRRRAVWGVRVEADGRWRVRRTGFRTCSTSSFVRIRCSRRVRSMRARRPGGVSCGPS